MTANKVDENASELVGNHIYYAEWHFWRHLFQILDSKELIIENIYEVGLNKTLDFQVGEAVGEFGSKLTVNLPPKDSNK